jgi:hypothetical protein
MKLASALDLKAEMISKARAAFVASEVVVGRSPAELARIVKARRVGKKRRSEASFPPIAAVRVPHPRPKLVAAFGVAPTSRRTDFLLAVRVFKGQERVAMPLIERQRVPPSELDLASGLVYRPRVTVRAGGSCGHFRITAGTLGGFVQDDDGYYILSNNHILANSDDCAVGDPVLQPGPLDVRQNRFTVIGDLTFWAPLGNGQGRVDAAMAAFSDRVSHFYPWSYAGIGEIKRLPVDDRFATRNVIKRGRTTGVTRGVVSAFDLDGVAIDYSEAQDGSRTVTFDNQLEFVGAPPTRPFSQPGDSGSLIIDRDSLRPYALLYAGGPDNQGIDRTLAHYLPEVLDELGVSLVQ